MAKNDGSLTTSEAIGTILSKLCLPAAEELGQLWGERVADWRKANAEGILLRANEKFEREGLGSGVFAHPRLAHIALDEGSWNDDDLVQEMWAGLLVSSCSEQGKDESNLIFLNLLAQLTSLEIKVLNYACEICTKDATGVGWISPTSEVHLNVKELQELTGVSDFHRIDRELDHMRTLELITNGFHPNSKKADITPTPFGIQMYVRAQGFLGSPLEYFGVEMPETE